jgi:two-component system cell cycle sensor histidine kinase/response regulator CckA
MILLNRLTAGSAVLVLVALGALAAGIAVGTGETQSYLFGAAASLTAIFGAIHVASYVGGVVAQRRLRAIMSFVASDTVPTFCSDMSGIVRQQNPAATDRFQDRIGLTMTQLLDPLVANPEAVFHRLSLVAEGRASAKEDVTTPRGQARIAASRIPGGFLWRIETLTHDAVPGTDRIGIPSLTFGPSGAVLSMNSALHEILGRRARRLRDMFETVPLESGGINRLRTRNGLESVRLVITESVNGRQEVFVMPTSDRADGRVELDSLPVALLRLDEEGRVTFANRPAQDLLPQTQTGVETRFAAMVEGLGRSVIAWVEEAAAGRGLNRPEIVRVTGAVTETYLQVTLGRTVGEGGSGLIAVLNDATELKTMEAQFVQSQKMQAIGQLAGGVAHDFNNLLTAISGHCDLLLLRHADGDEDHGDLMQITQNANRAAALVNQLLAFSRKQTLKMQQIDLRDTVTDLGHLLNRLVGDRVRLVTVHDPALLPIRGDRRQLEQVLMNLVVNARDAMPDGGEVRIETGCRYLARPVRRNRVTVPPGQYVVVSVTDEGHGIPADLLPRIFEPFITTKRPGEGTGLGLSMVYGIVKQSGGFIFAESVPGRGARFEIFLPAGPQGAGQNEAGGDGDPAGDDLIEIFTPAVGEAASPMPSVELETDTNVLAVGPPVDPAAPAEERRAGESDAASTEPRFPIPSRLPSDAPRRILLVEDEAPVRAFAVRALRMKGYEVREAANAEEALAILDDVAVEVDLFLTDVMMPGLDGPTWVTQALEARPDVRTVFMSGYSQNALERLPAQNGKTLFLAKPFPLAELIQTVERALGDPVDAM